MVPTIGTVEAPPDRDVSEKLPSGLVTIHEFTPLEFQKIDVRAPIGTDEGTAQMSACGGTYDAGVVATGGRGTGGLGEATTCCVMRWAVSGAGPTWYPRSVQRLSKNEVWIRVDMKLPAQL